MLFARECDFALPRVTYAAAGDGCDAIAVRQVNHAWHAALRKLLRSGLLDDMRFKLNIESLVVALSPTPPVDSDDEDSGADDAWEGCQRHPPWVTLEGRGAGGREVMAVAFAPYGTAVTLVTADRQTRTYDVATGRLRVAFEGHTGFVQAVAYSPDGERLLTASLDATARLWEAATGREVMVFASVAGPLYDVAFSPCGRRVLAACFGGEATVWSAESGAELLHLRGHGSVVLSAEYSEDGRYILTASRDGRAQLWHAETGAESHTLGVEGEKLRGATFSPDGPLRVLMVSESGLLTLWDAAGGAELRRWSRKMVAGAVFSPCAGKILATCRDYKVWLLATDPALTPQPEPDVLVMESNTYEVQSAGFSPCGRFMVTASGGVTGTVRLWSVDTRAQLCAHSATPGVVSGVNRIAFSPCGSRLLVGSYSGVVRIWGRGLAF